MGAVRAAAALALAGLVMLSGCFATARDRLACAWSCGACGYRMGECFGAQCKCFCQAPPWYQAAHPDWRRTGCRENDPK